MKSVKRLMHGLLTLAILLSSFASTFSLLTQTAGAISSPPGGKWEYLNAGGGFNCALFSGGAYCWGLNDYGQLGDGTLVNRYTPKKVGGLLDGKTVTAIDAAGDHTCVIANGDAYCWGSNYSGQLGNGTTTDSLVPVAVSKTGVLAGKTLTMITTDFTDKSCAVSSEGRAYCWGSSNWGDGTLGDGSTSDSSVPVAVDMNGVLAGKTISDISSGTGHTCVIANGLPYCWGSGGYLGEGTWNNSTLPIAVDISGVLAGKTLKSISSDDYHTCALSTEGKAYCWGDNWAGMLGDGTNNSLQLPVAVDMSGVLAGKTISSISTGGWATCALADGEEYCWGWNGSGHLGDGTTIERDSPVRVSEASGLPQGNVQQTSNGVSLNSFGEHTCALANGNIYCWGNNYGGALGRQETGFRQSTTPVPLSDDSKQALGGSTAIKSFSAGNFTCAVNSADAAYCWGVNYSGQLGNGTTSFEPGIVPVPVSNSGVLAGKTIKHINVGGGHACVIASDDKAYCWGYNARGQLGNSTTSDSSIPVAVSTTGVLSGKTIKKISAGNLSTCVIASDDNAYCWGNNDYGELGNSTNTNSSVPVAVSTSGVLAGKTIKDITVGITHTCAIASDDKAYCWGKNSPYDSSGQLGDGTTTDSSVPVAVSTSGVLAGKSIKGITAGYNFNCAIASDDNAYCWGNGYSTGDGTGTDSSVPVAVSTSGVLAGKTIKKIDAFGARTCVIASDDNAYCWGQGGLGSNVNYSLAPVAVYSDGALSGKTITDLATGGASCVLTSDQQAYCWGYNSDGQLANPTIDRNPLPELLDYTLPSIDNLSSQMSTPLTKRPTFTGVAEPGSTIVVTVHSDPVTCTTTADSNGYWSCTLPSDLPAGQHTVNVVVTTSQGDVINLGPYTVTVNGSSSLSGNLNSPDTGGGAIVSLGVLGMIFVVICAAIYMLIPKRRKTL